MGRWDTTTDMRARGARPHTHTHSHILTLKHTVTQSHSYSYSHSPSITHSHIHCHIHSHTHSHAHMHTHTPHPHTCRHTERRGVLGVRQQRQRGLLQVQEVVYRHVVICGVTHRGMGAQMRASSRGQELTNPATQLQVAPHGDDPTGAAAVGSERAQQHQYSYLRRVRENGGGGACTHTYSSGTAGTATRAPPPTGLARPSPWRPWGWTPQG